MKILFLTFILSIPTYSIAGGGGCEVCPPFPPQELIAICKINHIDKINSENLPTGKHLSFTSATNLLEKFKLGSQFFLQGGVNYQKVFSIYYASFDNNKKYPEFNDYTSPVPVSVDPFDFSGITLHQMHTSSRYIGAFPLIGETFLFLEKGDGDDVKFDLTWTHENSFYEKNEIHVATGLMTCELDEKY